MYKCFEFSPAHNKHETVRLCYLVQDAHCYPILNEDIITKVAKKANGTIDHLADKIEYSCESDLIYAPDYLNEDDPIWETGLLAVQGSRHCHCCPRISVYRKLLSLVDSEDWSNRALLQIQ